METDPERLGSCDKDNNQFGNECLGTCSHPTVTRSGTGGEVRKQVTQMNDLEAEEVMDSAPEALFEKKKTTMEIGRKVSDMITKLRKQEVAVAEVKSVKEV